METKTTAQLSRTETDYTPKTYTSGENTAFAIKMAVIVIALVGLLWVLNRFL